MNHLPLPGILWDSTDGSQCWSYTISPDQVWLTAFQSLQPPWNPAWNVMGWAGICILYFFRGGVVINLSDISFDLTQAWLVSGFSAKKDFLKQNVIVPNGMNKDHTSVEPPFQIFPKFFLLRTKIIGNLCHCVVSKSQNMWGNIFPQANQTVCWPTSKVILTGWL